MNSIITSSSSSLAEYPDLLTVGELQEIRRNDIAVVHIGRSIRIPKLAVINFLSDGA